MSRPFSTLWPDNQPRASPSSIEKVLSTYELLESILLHLPIHSIFTSHRVSRRGQSIIHQSVPLREKMFPTSSAMPLRPEITIYNETVCCCFNRGQTLYRLEAPLTFNSAGSIDQISDHSSPPMLTKPIAAFRAYSHEHRFPQLAVEGLPDTPQSTQASWMKMFLTEPPITAVDFRFGGSLKSTEHTFVVWNPDGVRLGDLIRWRWEIVRKMEENGQEAAGVIECSWHVSWPGFDPNEEIW